MHVVQARSAAPAAAVWSLLAEPARWRGWAPHIRGADGLGTPQVQAGARGLVRLTGGISVPVKITGVDPGRDWRWQAGPLHFRHAVSAEGAGSVVRFEMSAPSLLEPVLVLTYGPVMALVARRLAHVASL